LEKNNKVEWRGNGYCSHKLMLIYMRVDVLMAVNIKIGARAGLSVTPADEKFLSSFP
jgi:hypothetical protein